MTEIDVTLTDYALTLLCSWFAWRLLRTSHRLPTVGQTWTIFFASIAVAGATGGTVHGFFPDRSVGVGYTLWVMTLGAIGLTATAAWLLIAELIPRPGLKKFSRYLIATAYVAYLTIVTMVSQRFVVAIAFYVPALVALLAAFLYPYIRQRRQSDLDVVIGVILSFIAAYIQLAKLGLHPDFFNHNATYHLVQALGLWLTFRGAQGHLTGIRRSVSS